MLVHFLVTRVEIGGSSPSQTPSWRAQKRAFSFFQVDSSSVFSFFANETVHAICGAAGSGRGAKARGSQGDSNQAPMLRGLMGNGHGARIGPHTRARTMFSARANAPGLGEMGAETDRGVRSGYSRSASPDGALGPVDSRPCRARRAIAGDGVPRKSAGGTLRQGRRTGPWPGNVYRQPVSHRARRLLRRGP